MRQGQGPDSGTYVEVVQLDDLSNLEKRIYEENQPHMSEACVASRLRATTSILRAIHGYFTSCYPFDSVYETPVDCDQPIEEDCKRVYDLMARTGLRSAIRQGRHGLVKEYLKMVG